jgi:hypothetical protein
MSNVISKAEFDFNDQDVVLVLEESDGLHHVVVTTVEGSTGVFSSENLYQASDVFRAIEGAYQALDLDC